MITVEIVLNVVSSVTKDLALLSRYDDYDYYVREITKACIDMLNEIYTGEMNEDKLYDIAYNARKIKQDPNIRS